MLELVKIALRVSNTALDAEIQNLIDAALADLAMGGIDTTSQDALIQRAVITYCKAYFGYDNPDADRLIKAYDMLKMHLMLSSEYQAVIDGEI